VSAPVISDDGMGAPACAAFVSVSAFRRSGAVDTSVCVEAVAPLWMPADLSLPESPGNRWVNVDAADDARINRGLSSIQHVLNAQSSLGRSEEEAVNTASYLERDRVISSACPYGVGQVPLAFSVQGADAGDK